MDTEDSCCSESISTDTPDVKVEQDNRESEFNSAIVFGSVPAIKLEGENEDAEKQIVLCSIKSEDEVIVETIDVLYNEEESDTKCTIKTEVKTEGSLEFTTPSIKTEDDKKDPNESESDIKTEDDESQNELSTEESLSSMQDSPTAKDGSSSIPKKTKQCTSSTTKKTRQCYECDVCEKTFSRQWDLKIHRRTHTGERPYACTYCDETFISNSHRKRHEIMHTKDSKPFKCDKCIRSFHSRTELAEHDFSHTGISKHCCDQCGSFFSNSSALKTHVKRIHETPRNTTQGRGSKASKYSPVMKCDKCGKDFKKKKDFEDHCNFHCYFKALEAVRAQKLGLKKEPT